MKLDAYVMFDGTCEEAFRLYAKALGGTIVMMSHYRDAPKGSGPAPTAETANLVMHARLKVGDRFLMGSDAPKQFAEKPQGFSVTVSTDTPEEADRIWAVLAEGANIRMAPAETFWAKRFGMLTDRYGIPWMINCEKPMADYAPDAAKGEATGKAKGKSKAKA